MVRDAALWIVSKEDKAIKVAAKSLSTTDENIEKLAAMFLRSLENLPTTDQLQFPKLKILLLHSMDEYSLQVPNAYFGGMEMLEVLGTIIFFFKKNEKEILFYIKTYHQIGHIQVINFFFLHAYFKFVKVSHRLRIWHR